MKRDRYSDNEWTNVTWCYRYHSPCGICDNIFYIIHHVLNLLFFFILLSLETSATIIETNEQNGNI